VGRSIREDGLLENTSIAAMALQANKLTHRFHTSLLGVLRARHLLVARTVRGVMCALS
jgi:uncharacterized protein (DUF2236 family)